MILPLFTLESAFFQFYAKKMDNTDLNCHSDLVLEFMKIREAAMDFIQARTKSIFLEYPFTGLFYSRLSKIKIRQQSYLNGALKIIMIETYVKIKKAIEK